MQRQYSADIVLPFRYRSTDVPSFRTFSTYVLNELAERLNVAELMVELRGLEPLTSSVQRRRSPN